MVLAAAGEETTTLHSSVPCYVDCWHAGLLYAILVGLILASSKVKGDELLHDGPHDLCINLRLHSSSFRAFLCSFFFPTLQGPISLFLESSYKIWGICILDCATHGVTYYMELVFDPPPPDTPTMDKFMCSLLFTLQYETRDTFRLSGGRFARCRRDAGTSDGEGSAPGRADQPARGGEKRSGKLLSTAFSLRVKIRAVVVCGLLK